VKNQLRRVNGKNRKKQRTSQSARKERANVKPGGQAHPKADGRYFGKRHVLLHDKRVRLEERRKGWSQKKAEGRTVKASLGPSEETNPRGKKTSKKPQFTKRVGTRGRGLRGASPQRTVLKELTPTEQRGIPPHGASPERRKTQMANVGTPAEKSKKRRDITKYSEKNMKLKEKES